MSTVLTPSRTLAEWSTYLGDIPPERIITDPSPGLATWEDAVLRSKPACEWIEGVLVEKAMGQNAALIELGLGAMLYTFVAARRLGKVGGAQSMFWVSDQSFRMPDITFYSTERLAQLPVPTPEIFPVAPELAVEVLSPSNTGAEMARKRAEYFSAGVRLVWIVDPDSQTVTVWTDETLSSVLSIVDTLTGGDVLPGFTVRVADIFAAGV